MKKSNKKCTNLKTAESLMAVERKRERERERRSLLNSNFCRKLNIYTQIEQVKHLFYFSCSGKI